MFELSGTIAGLGIDYKTGNAVLNIAVKENRRAVACVEELSQCERLSFKISKYREKRSNDANSYLWVLCSKLADKLSDDGVPHTKEEVYRDAVKARGVYKEQGELPIEFAKTSRTAWNRLDHRAGGFRAGR